MSSTIDDADDRLTAGEIADLIVAAIEQRQVDDNALDDCYRCSARDIAALAQRTHLQQHGFIMYWKEAMAVRGWLLIKDGDDDYVLVEKRHARFAKRITVNRDSDK